MFRINPSPTFNAPVKIPVAGQSEPVTIGVEFRHMSRSRLTTFFDECAGQTDAQVLAQIVAGWSDVDRPYSPEALALLIDNYPGATRALFETFRAELLEAGRKNS